VNDLIAALTIFAKYKNVRNPTHCEHDALYIMRVSKEEVSPEDAKRLEELGFFWGEANGGCWMSYRFGSA